MCTLNNHLDCSQIRQDKMQIPIDHSSFFNSLMISTSWLTNTTHTIFRTSRGASSVRFPLQQNRYPSELVDFLRLLLVEPEDLGMQVGQIPVPHHCLTPFLSVLPTSHLEIPLISPLSSLRTPLSFSPHTALRDRGLQRAYLPLPRAPCTHHHDLHMRELSRAIPHTGGGWRGTHDEQSGVR